MSILRSRCPRLRRKLEFLAPDPSVHPPASIALDPFGWLLASAPTPGTSPYDSPPHATTACPAVSPLNPQLPGPYSESKPMASEREIDRKTPQFAKSLSPITIGEECPSVPRLRSLCRPKLTRMPAGRLCSGGGGPRGSDRGINEEPFGDPGGAEPLVRAVRVPPYPLAPPIAHGGPGP